MNKIQKLEQWKKDLQAKIDKKEGEALAAKVNINCIWIIGLIPYLFVWITFKLTTSLKKLFQRGNINQSAVCTFLTTLMATGLVATIKPK